jgi:hypothetical protein
MHKLKRLTSLSVPVVLALAASAQQADISATVSIGPTQTMAAPAPGQQNSGALLHDNGPFITGVGTGFGGADISEIETGFNTFGYGFQNALGLRLADDFTVPSGQTWTLSNLHVRGYQTGAPTSGTMTGGFVQIWSGGAPMSGGVVLAGDTTTNRMLAQVWTGVYRVTSTTQMGSTRPIIDIDCDMSWAPPLGAGTYWVDFSATGSLASGPFAPPTVPHAAGDNALQFNAGAWGAVIDAVAMLPQDFPYVLEGTSGGGCTSDSLTTFFIGTNQGSIGGMNYFDADVLNASGLTVTDLDVNVSTTTPLGTNFSVEVYTTPGTSVGNQTNMSVWTLVAKGNAVSNASDTPTPVDVSDFFLAQGQYGIGIRFFNAGLRYTNGTGTNQFFSNADLSLTLGTASNVPFTASIFSPRVWNGTVYYDLGGCCPTPSTYCTAQVNSQGCTPAISSVGTPNALAGSGFVIDGTQVLPNVNGILAYSTNGNNASPFMGGTLCVRTPLTRTSVQNSAATGAPPCTGVFSIDFNDWILNGGDPALVAGAEVWAQYWSRDQGAAFGSSLTDALNFVICP